MSFSPKFKTLVEMLSESVRTHADRPLFGVRQPDGEWRFITYAAFAADVDAARGALASLGVGRGDQVAVISNNRLEWAIGCYATYQLGGAYVPMYEAQLDRDWAYILRDSGAKVCLVASEAIAARVKHVVPEITVVCFGAEFDALLAKGRQAPVDVVAPAPSDLATMVYTSGTTGKPKGVMLTHQNQVSNVCAVAEVFPIGPGDVGLAFLPWAHVAGGSAELHGVVAFGAATGIVERPEQLLESLPKVRPTYLIAVPRIWNRIYDGMHKQIAERPATIQKLFHAGLRAADKKREGKGLGVGEAMALALAQRLIFSKVRAKLGGRLRYAISGAAALSPDVARFIDAIGIPVYEAYGMTETSAVSTLNAPAFRRIGSVGKPIPGVEVRLDHTVAGGDAQNGEIIVYGHGVMAGYRNLPEVSAEVMTKDGGLRTGDLGRFDDDGFLFITGRVKEIYKLNNGKYVAPAPLEEKITLSPYIAQAFVHGQDRPFNVALVVIDVAAVAAWAKQHGLAETDPQALCASDRVRALLRGEIDRAQGEWKGFERVQDFIATAEEFTTANDLLTPTLKVKRRNVLARYGAELERMFQAAKAQARAS
jgi:long-chain acyl-CoA synthetase